MRGTVWRFFPSNMFTKLTGARMGRTRCQSTGCSRQSVVCIAAPFFPVTAAMACGDMQRDMPTTPSSVILRYRSSAHIPFFSHTHGLSSLSDLTSQQNILFFCLFPCQPGYQSWLRPSARILAASSEEQVGSAHLMYAPVFYCRLVYLAARKR